MTNEEQARYGRDAMRVGSPDYQANDARSDAVDTIANVLHAAAMDDTAEATAICDIAMHHHYCEVTGLD